MKKIILISTLFVMLMISDLFSQDNSNITEKDTKIRVSAIDGVLVAGYVDGGGYTNFTGPNINLTIGHSRYLISALPSLRYKNDTSEPRNAFVTPTLGLGFTYSYRAFAIQLPLYYNPKTSTENGSWHMGIGLGLRLNYL